MITPEEKRIMLKAVHKWGEYLQVVVTAEELAELQKELLKILREWDGAPLRKSILRLSLIEEMADVEIMIDQIKVMIECEPEVANMRELKLTRVKEMLDEKGR